VRLASTRGLAAAAVLVGLTVLHTWPLARSPAHLSLNGNADAQLNEWIISWIAHALPTRPHSLFDANIFAPERQTLVYSEPLIVPALLVAPVRWLGGSPVLAFNLALMAGLSATAWSAWFLVWRWTDSWPAGIVAGALIAFNVHLLTRLPHLQAAHAWGLPLGLYFADRLVDRIRLRHAVALSVIVAATAATSLYWLVLLILVLLSIAAVHARRWRAVSALAGATAAGLVIALPVLAPYIRFAAAGAARPLEVVAQLSASSSGYLASTSVVWRSITNSMSHSAVDLFFPGVTALLLATAGAISLARTSSEPPRRVWYLGLIALSAYLLSLGPSTVVYRAAYAVLLPLHGIRAAARFGYLVLLVVGIAAGVGFNVIERRWRPGRFAGLGLTAIVALISAEAWQGPAPVEPFSEVPRLYRLVHDAPGLVLLAEFPFYLPAEVFQNGEYVVNSTAHWRPLMNGYSGVTPDSYRRIAEPMWLFPAGFAIDAIHQSGVTHVMVHLEKFGDDGPAVERALRELPDFQLLGSDARGHRLYRVVAPTARHPSEVP